MAFDDLVSNLRIVALTLGTISAAAKDAKAATDEAGAAAAAALPALTALLQFGPVAIGLPSAAGPQHPLEAKTDVLPNSEGAPPSGETPPTAPRAATDFHTFLIAMTSKIDALPAKAKAAAAEVQKAMSGVDRILAAQEQRLEANLKQIAASASAGRTGQEFLEELELLIRDQNNPRLAPEALVEIRRTIQGLVREIQTYFGKAGMSFSLSQFESWVKRHQPPVSSGNSALPPMSIDALISTGNL